MKTRLIILFISVSCYAIKVQAEGEIKFQLRKCCSQFEIIDVKTMSCVQNVYQNSDNTSLIPDIMLDKSNPKKQIVETPSLDLDITYGLISCPSSKLKVLDMTEDFDYLLAKDEETLVSIGGTYENSFQIGEFCLDLATTDNPKIPLKRIAVTCDPCQGSDRSCIKTCCPHFQISRQADDGSFKCVNQPGKIKPLKVSQWNPNFETEKEMVKNTDYLLVNDKNFQCSKNRNNPSGIFLPTSENATYRLFSDGSIEITDFGQGLNLSSENYCVNFFGISGDGQQLVDESFLICVPDDEEVCVACILYPICCTISNIFLVLTFVVYAILPELRKSLIGKVIMIFIVALFSAYLSLSAVAFGGREIIEDFSGCQLLAFLVQFSFLHAFFWMNVLSFVIFRTAFKSSEMESKRSEKKSLTVYIFYAVCTPLLISMATAAVQYLPDENGILDSIRPDFGERKCFFDQDKQLSSLIFFYAPLLLTLISSIVFFVLTTYKVSQQVNPHHESFRSHFVTILKLYAIMGINWVFEFVSFIAEWQWDEEMARNLSYLSDVINLLQGLLIFIVLVCNREVFKSLRERLSMKKDLEPIIYVKNKSPLSLNCSA